MHPSLLTEIGREWYFMRQEKCVQKHADAARFKDGACGCCHCKALLVHVGNAAAAAGHEQRTLQYAI